MTLQCCIKGAMKHMDILLLNTASIHATMVVLSLCLVQFSNTEHLVRAENVQIET